MTAARYGGRSRQGPRRPSGVGLVPGDRQGRQQRRLGREDLVLDLLDDPIGVDQGDDLRDLPPLRHLVVAAGSLPGLGEERPGDRALLVAGDGRRGLLERGRGGLVEAAEGKVGGSVPRVDPPSEELVALLRDEEERGSVGDAGDPEPAIGAGAAPGPLRAVARLVDLGPGDRLAGRVDHAARPLPACRPPGGA